MTIRELVEYAEKNGMDMDTEIVIGTDNHNNPFSYRSIDVKYKNGTVKREVKTYKDKIIVG